MSNPNQGRSPYKKHNKKEFLYSEPYQQWKAAVIKGDRNAIEINRARHNRLFGLTPGKYAQRDAEMALAA
jgi:hypothetical protein